MGHVYATVNVRGLKGKKTLKEVIVDTGATFTVMPTNVVEEVDAIKSPWSLELMLGDKRKVTAAVYLAEVELNGRKGPMRIAAFKEAIPAIGADIWKRWDLKRTLLLAN